MQSLSEVARQDGLNHPDIEALASIGACGVYLANTRRDLLKKLLPAVELPEPRLVDVPFVAKRSSGRQVLWLKHPLLYPHEMFDAINKKYPDH